MCVCGIILACYNLLIVINIAVGGNTQSSADLNFKYAVSGHVGSLPDTNYWLSYNFVKFILQII